MVFADQWIKIFIFYKEKPVFQGQLLYWLSNKNQSVTTVIQIYPYNPYILI